jgi:hypothetical protein
MTAALLLTGCAATVSSEKAICSINLPTFTESELISLSDNTLNNLDVFVEKFRRACGR